MFSPYGFPQNGARLLLAVIVASTANVADLTSCSTTMDGVTLEEGNLVLLKNQTATEDNGVYKVGKVEDTHAPLTRHDLADIAMANGGGVHVYVAKGTLNAGLEYALTTAGTIVIGTTSLAFTQRPTQAAVTSLETRLSGAESVGELSSESVYTSLTTRVSTEEATRSTADASLTTRVSTEESTRTSADTSLTAKDSVNLSTALSTIAALDTAVSGDVASLDTVYSAEVASIDTRISSLIASIDG
jgi:hypothetical protein